MIALYFICACAFGALFARMDGGGEPKTPEWVERTLCMLVFMIACAPFAGMWALAAYLGVVGIATGHGQYFLARALKRIKPERVDFIVRLFFGRDPRETSALASDLDAYGSTKLYCRCVFGMFVTGTLVGLPAAILALCYGQYAAALLFSLTGVAKALAYIAGYELFKATEPAEWINGFLRTGLALLTLGVL